MTDDLLDLEVGMLLRRIVIEERLELIDEVVVFVGYFEVGHDYVVRRVGPIVLVSVVDPVSLAGEVQSLHDELVGLLQERTPLNRSDRPIQDVLVDEIIEAVVVLAPLHHAVGLACLHYI